MTRQTSNRQSLINESRQSDLIRAIRSRSTARQLSALRQRDSKIPISTSPTKTQEWNTIGKQTGVRLPTSIQNTSNYIKDKLSQGYVQKGNKLVKIGKRSKVFITIKDGKVTKYSYTSKKKDFEATYSNGFMQTYRAKDKSGRITGTTKVDFVNKTATQIKRRSGVKKTRTFDFKQGSIKTEKRAISTGVASIQKIPGFEGGINRAVLNDKKQMKNLEALRVRLRDGTATTKDIKDAGGLVLTDPKLKRRILRDSPQLRTLERKVKKEDRKGTIVLSVLKNKAKGKQTIFAEVKSGKKGKFSAFQGSIVAAPRPEGFIERLSSDIAMKQEKIGRDIELKKTKGTEAQFKGIAVQALLGTASAGLGVITLIKDPIKTVKAQFNALRPKNIGATVQGEFRRFEINPVGVLTEYALFGKLLKLAGRPVVKNPLARTVKEELFIRAQPVQVRGPVRTILEASRVQEKINPSGARKLKKIDFLEVKEFKNAAEANAMKKTIIQTDSVVFGSLPARTLSKKKTPIPKDVDLATKNIAIFNRKFLQNLPPKLRKNYGIKGQKIYRKSDNVAIADVKSISKLIPNRSLFTGRGELPVVGYVTKVGLKKGLPSIKRKKVEGAITVPTQKQAKVGAIKVIGFGEQTTRKALGTLQVLIEKNVRRAKDPQSLLVALEIQLQSLAKSKPKTPLGKLRKRRGTKKLNSAIKMLKSSSFRKLLDRKVPGLTREFPLVSKIDPKKLRRKLKATGARKAAAKILQEKKGIKLSEDVLRRQKVARRRGQKIKTSNGKTTTARKKRSKLPEKILKSRLPSKIPKSRLPSRLSGIPSIFKTPVSGLSSFIPSSRLPSILTSKIPSIITPSRIPGKILSSKIPSPITSKIPSRVWRPTRTPPPRQLDEDKKNKLKREIVKTLKIGKRLIYIPDLYSRIYGLKVDPTQKKKFTQKGALFSGVEIRKII